MNCFTIQSQGPTLVPATSPTNSNQFEFVGLVAGTKFCLRLVAGTSPIVCFNLYEFSKTLKSHFCAVNEPQRQIYRGKTIEMSQASLKSCVPESMTQLIPHLGKTGSIDVPKINGSKFERFQNLKKLHFFQIEIIFRRISLGDL